MSCCGAFLQGAESAFASIENSPAFQTLSSNLIAAVEAKLEKQLAAHTEQITKMLAGVVPG